MRKVAWIVGEREQIHFVLGGQRAQLVKRADLVAFIGGVRHAVAEEQNSHKALGDLK